MGTQFRTITKLSTSEIEFFTSYKRYGEVIRELHKAVEQKIKTIPVEELSTAHEEIGNYIRDYPYAKKDNLNSSRIITEKKKMILNLNSPRITTEVGEEKKVTWDCIYFGRYPQREAISLEIEFIRLQKETSWDRNDDMTVNSRKYRRVKEKNGGYRYFLYEPIKWRVLKIEEEEALLLSDIALDAMPYHKRREGINWEKCDLRKWLNENFQKAAFNLQERKCIKKSCVHNEDNKEHGTKGGADTEDSIYLLSISQVDEGRESTFLGFIHEKSRETKTSQFGKKQGCSIRDENVYWWLRSPGGNTGCAAYVNYDGWVDCWGFDGSDFHRGIRPVLKLNLESLDLHTYAGTVSAAGK